jgi:hypothetical protein
MKLKQFKEFINESIINPIDTKDIIGIVKSIEHIDSLDDINNALEDYNIHFSFYDEFFNSLGTQEEKDVAPPENIYTPSAIKFALYNKYIGKINFVVIDNFIEIFNRGLLNSHRFYDELSETIKHESIHSQQVSRMGINNYLLIDSPTNPDKYFSNKSEIMAYANSFVIEMTKQKSKEEVVSLLRSEKQIKNWIFDCYKKYVNEKDFHRFIKYVYLYLQEL